MDDDREIARRFCALQANGRDFRMVDLPGYMEWSRRKLAEEESPAAIEHLDGTCVWLLPTEANQMTSSDYDEMLEELKEELEKGSS